MMICWMCLICCLLVAICLCLVGAVRWCGFMSCSRCVRALVRAFWFSFVGCLSGVDLILIWVSMRFGGSHLVGFVLVGCFFGGGCRVFGRVG